MRILECSCGEGRAQMKEDVEDCTKSLVDGTNILVGKSSVHCVSCGSLLYSSPKEVD